jgi:L,D-peptidoglycan transpeptidase YkuD (ErfK/YbiS/YcfS/YnhG family)
MIIINKYGLLKYKNLKFRCSLGKSGIGEKKKEGDCITPKGEYKIIKVFYRADRIKTIKSNFKLYKIKKNMGWCDDPLSKNYNKLIKLPSKFGHEKLYRKDKLYDLILVLNYNLKPIIKNKGSAIFIHITNKNYKETKGCIGLKKKDLIFILNDIKKNITVKIT